MKNHILGLLIILMCQACTLSSIAQNAMKSNFVDENVSDTDKGIAVITGHGDALPEEYVVRLIKWEDGHSDYVATDTIANGQFRFEIPVGEGLSIYSLIFDYHAFPSMVHRLYLTSGAKVDIETVDNYSYTWPI